jgi:hypothetical protein
MTIIGLPRKNNEVATSFYGLLVEAEFYGGI